MSREESKNNKEGENKGAEEKLGRREDTTGILCTLKMIIIGAVALWRMQAKRVR